MKKATVLIGVLAVFAFGSAQACDWKNQSTKVNYAKLEKSTPRPAAIEQPVVVDIREQDKAVAANVDTDNTAN